jgi:hypothetical protein
MVTPVPPPLIDAPRLPVCDPLDQPVKVLSSKPASGIEIEVAFAFGDETNVDTNAIINAGIKAQDPFLNLMFFTYRL